MTPSVADALSRLQAIPWQDLKHACGPATDVPGLIKALAQPDQKLRDAAWQELYGSLWHQGTIYEATGHAVPFLIRLLDVDEVQEKHKILIYLTYLFCGRSYLERHGSHLGRDVSQGDFEHQLQAELAWVNATQQAVTAGLESYIQQLYGTAIKTRIAAAYLLGVIGDRADDGERDSSIPEEIEKSCEGTERR